MAELTADHGDGLHVLIAEASGHAVGIEIGAGQFLVVIVSDGRTLSD